MGHLDGRAGCADEANVVLLVGLMEGNVLTCSINRTQAISQLKANLDLLLFVLLPFFWAIAQWALCLCKFQVKKDPGKYAPVSQPLSSHFHV
jgi:hypothetical protein